MPLVSRIGACVIQRLQGEWLVLICYLLRCHYVFRAGAREIQCLHGEWLALMCRDTTGVSRTGACGIASIQRAREDFAKTQ